MINLRYLLVTFLLLTYLPVYAFTLGQVKVNSFINQNLDAEIEVLSIGKMRLEKLKAFLASKEDFKKFDLERENYLENIRFVTYQEESGRTFIHLTSTKIIREPLVSFVVTLRSLEGNISREYNLFLSPSPDTRIQPVFKSEEKVFSRSNNQFQQPTLNQSKAKQFNKKANTTVKKKHSGVYRPDLNYAIEEYQTVSNYGPVKPGDLLTFIAQKIRPDDTYAVQKISKLLYQYNPNAFTNGDINKLKVGHILKVPALDKPEFRKNSLAYLDKDKKQIQQEPSEQKTDQELSNEDVDNNQRVSDNLASSTVAQEEGKLTLLSDDLEINNAEVDTQQLLKLSMDKVQTLNDENKLMKEQFDLLIGRMEEVINKNDLLDKELKQLRSEKELDSQQQISNETLISEAEINTPEKQETSETQQPGEVIVKVESALPVKQTQQAIDTSEYKTAESGTVIENNSVQNRVAEIDWYYWMFFVLAIVLLLLFAFVLIVKLKIKKTSVNEEFSLVDVMNKSDEKDKQRVKSKAQSEFTSKPVLNADVNTQPKSSKIVEDSRENTEHDLTTNASSNKATESELRFDIDNDLDLDLDLDESNIHQDHVKISQVSDNVSTVVQSSQNNVDFGSTIETDEEKATEERNKGSNAVADNTLVSSPGINFDDILGPSKSSNSADNVDLLSQSSVYFAYGKFDLAEQLLIDGIAKDQNNKLLKLKLFECYSKMDDEEKFMSYLDQEKESYNQDDEFNDKIKDMYSKQWNKELY
jgi:pilus assembly protein FimV